MPWDQDYGRHYLVLMAEGRCAVELFPSERIISMRRSLEKTSMTDNLTDQTIANIVQTWRGGEHRLAGRRASELVFGAGKTPNQKIVDQLSEECPGIGEFISAPEVPVNWVNADRPAFKTDEDYSNKSPDSSKADQDAIDKTLEAGRKRSEQAPDDQNLTGSTKLNPEETPVAAPKGKPGKK
jgi:hypothetical protein